MPSNRTGRRRLTRGPGHGRGPGHVRLPPCAQVLVSGSHGLIGTALVAALEHDGNEVVRLVRGPAGAGQVTWEPEAGQLDVEAVARLDGVVHLAGAPIGEKRWTPERKQAIRDSRVVTTDLLARRLAETEPRPSVLVSGSAVGYYGDRGEAVLDESSAAGAGFLAEVCRQWEEATAPAAAAGIRVVHARTGIVLSPTGGALKKMLPLFRFGLGGRFDRATSTRADLLDDEVGAIMAFSTPPRRSSAPSTSRPPTW